MPAHIAGVIRFELPLRGESLAAWLNSCFMKRVFRTKPLTVQNYAIAGLSKHRPHLVPQRGTFPVAIMFRWRRLRGAHRIGCRETIHQTGLEFGVDFLVGQSGLAGIDGMLVVWRRIEFLSHVGPPSAV
jgi:hypothetical protein